MAPPTSRRSRRADSSGHPGLRPSGHRSARQKRTGLSGRVASLLPYLHRGFRLHIDFKHTISALHKTRCAITDRIAIERVIHQQALWQIIHCDGPAFCHWRGLALFKAQYPAPIAIQNLAITVGLLAAIDRFFFRIVINAEHRAVISLGDVTIGQFLTRTE